MSLFTGEMSPMERFAALAPAVDRYVRETYNDLLSLPVPENLCDLIRAYEQQFQAKENLKDGTTD